MAKCIVLGEEHQTAKKPIEFVCAEAGQKDGGRLVPIADPNSWGCIELVCKAVDDNHYDIMFAYDEGSRSHGSIFFGHWNDGVVE